jgi:hypothetical protein
VPLIIDFVARNERRGAEGPSTRASASAR